VCRHGVGLDTARSYVIVIQAIITNNELSVQLEIQIAGIRLTVIFLILLFSLFVDLQSHRKIVVRHVLGRRNRRGQVIVDFCERSEIVIGNTWFDKPKRRSYTWKEPEIKADISRITILGSAEYNQQDANFSQLIFFTIYFCKTPYMFQTVFPSIIRSSKLHIQHQVFLRPILLLAASLARLAAGSSIGLTNVQRLTKINKP